MAARWHGQTKPGHQETLVGWISPPLDWVALNTGGASRKNSGMAGGGGVFKDWKGEWLGGFAEKIGTCSSTRAALRAVLRGYKLQGRGVSQNW